MFYHQMNDKVNDGTNILYRKNEYGPNRGERMKARNGIDGEAWEDRETTGRSARQEWMEWEVVETKGDGCWGLLL